MATHHNQQLTVGPNLIPSTPLLLIPHTRKRPTRRNGVGGSWRAPQANGSAMGSKDPDRISGPLKTKLSNSKRICPRPNTAKINIDMQISNVVLELRHPRRAQNQVTRFCE